METKNLTNCTPLEFLKQTNKIKKAVEKWLTVTEFKRLRKQMPDLTNITDKIARQEAIKEQAMKNLSAILDKALEEHPEQTLEILALACFVEPEDVNKHPMTFYLKSFADMIGDEGVWTFFTSLSRLGQMNGLSLQKQSE